MGHFMADFKYGLNSSQPQYLQPGKAYYNGSVSAHINVLEGFNPNYTPDPFKWIPKGLYQDLRDAANETRPPQFVNDEVSNYIKSANSIRPSVKRAIGPLRQFYVFSFTKPPSIG